MNIRKCSVIGLGKLGACMSAAIASKGFNVIGVDKNPDFVKAFNQRKPPIFEPGLEKMIKKHGSRIHATTDYNEAVADSDITFIVVPTPSDPGGGFSLRYVKKAADNIGKVLSKKNSFHIVVITSTVLPGSINLEIVPLIEKASKKKCGRNFGLCYNPEFIALGTVIPNFLNPDFILIGESDKNTGAALENFYKKICDNKPSFARMNFVNAELTKIAVNSYITTKITFANMLAELAEKLPGGDVDVITDALGSDSRIGKRCLKGGLGYGGPCFPRDNAALASVAKKLKVHADVPNATDEFNRRIVNRVFQIVKAKIKPGEVVGVLGLSYKPLSNVIEESQPVSLLESFKKSGIKIVVYDPLAMGNVKAVFKNSVRFTDSARSLIKCSDILIIANPDPEFVKLKISDFSDSKRLRVIVDCWRIFRHIRFFALDYIPLGIGK